MKLSPDKNKLKMYFTVGLIMIIIVTAWILNLKNSLNNQSTEQNDFQNLGLEEKWQQMTTNLSQIFSNIEELRESLEQAPTSSATQLQAAAQITPEQLDEVIERLKTETPTTTTSTPEEIN